MFKFIMLRQARRGRYRDVMRTVCIVRAQGKGYSSDTRILRWPSVQLSLQKDNTRKRLSKVRYVKPGLQ